MIVGQTGAGALSSSINVSGRIPSSYGDMTRTWYPSPFFDPSNTSMPSDFRDLLRWCKYFALTHPIVHSILVKRAMYPVTDPTYNTKDKKLAGIYRQLYEEDMGIKMELANIQLDKYAYGNAFVSMSFPFRKFIVCGGCKKETLASDADYTYSNGEFRIKCSCGYWGKSKAVDKYLRIPSKIGIVRWNPECIKIIYNPITGKSTYYLIPSQSVINLIKAGVKSVIESTPQLFLDAVATSSYIMLNPAFLLHLKRITPSNEDYAGWGEPLPVPVFKDIYLMQTLRKAQEVIAHEYILPLRLVHPPIADKGGVYGTDINMRNFASNMNSMMVKWRKSPGLFMISPVPVGYQQLGGNGRMLLLNPEIQQMTQMISIGMLTPPSLLEGSAPWSGSNVLLRMYENECLSDRRDSLRVLRFATRLVSWFMQWPYIEMGMKPFKMADDLQRASFEAQLEAQGHISAHTLLEQLDHDWDKEQEIIREEQPIRGEYMIEQQKLSAKAQGEAQTILMGYQQQMQPTEPQMGAERGGVTAPTSPLSVQQGPYMDRSVMAESLARQIAGMPEYDAARALSNLKMQAPDMYPAVLQAFRAGRVSGGAEQQRYMPLPEQRPPRRGPESAMI